MDKKTFKEILELDRGVVEKYAIDASFDETLKEKMEYVKAQIDGFKAILWRSRVDIMCNHGLVADTEAQANEINAKINEHKKVVSGTVEVLKTLQELYAHLEAEIHKSKK